jgi:hypothetical protein
LLPWVIRLTAAGFAIFFSVLALHTLRVLDFGATYLSLVRWGSHGEAYELMICTIYLVWAPFLWRCARNPLAEKTFIDFTVVANVAHFGVMFFEGVLMEGEHVHLVGDVLLGWSGLILLMIFWIPVRLRASA